VYALGDLAQQGFQDCTWYCDAGGAPALVLLNRAFVPGVLFTLGEPKTVGALLGEMDHASQMYLHIRPEILPLVEERYPVLHVQPMWRMVLASTKAALARTARAVRLGPDHFQALQHLYSDGEPARKSLKFFSPAMLAEGVYFGAWEGEELVAAAGTHLVTPEQGVAAIGNVHTRRDRRGRGLGTSVTGAVTAELLRLHCRTVALNVNQQNTTAVRVYERLGFVRYFDYVVVLASFH
jgi:predicted GNAT family acetyltransferase